MVTLDNSTIVFTGSRENYSHKIIEGKDYTSLRINKYYRPSRFIIDNQKGGGKSTCSNSAEKNRIQCLETELSHYRNMLDEMVREKTEMLHRRLTIIEGCNIRLCDNYHKMREMYLELLSKESD